MALYCKFCGIETTDMSLEQSTEHYLECRNPEPEKVFFEIRSLETDKIRIKGVWFLEKGQTLLDKYVKACHQSGNQYMDIPTCNPITHYLVVVREHEACEKLSEADYKWFQKARCK